MKIILIIPIDPKEKSYYVFVGSGAVVTNPKDYE